MVASARAHSALPRDRIRSFSLHAPPSQGSPQLCPNVERRAYTPFVQRRMCDDNRLGIRHAADSHALRGSHRTALVIVSWNGRTPLGCHQIIILQQPGINIRSDWLYHLGGTYPSSARSVLPPICTRVPSYVAPLLLSSWSTSMKISFARDRGKNHEATSFRAPTTTSGPKNK